MTKELDDIYYIHLVKSGDVNAFVHIVRHYNKMIFTLVNKIVDQVEDAEDITQEIFIKAFQSIDKFREESEFSTWLYRIAYNTAISQTRKRKGYQISIEENNLSSSVEEISDSIEDISVEEQLGYLEKVLKMLPPNDSLLITMYYMNNQSIQDIAQITSLTQSNVKVKLYRIRKFLNLEINKLIAK